MSSTCLMKEIVWRRTWSQMSDISAVRLLRVRGIASLRSRQHTRVHDTVNARGINRCQVDRACDPIGSTHGAIVAATVVAIVAARRLSRNRRRDDRRDSRPVYTLQAIVAATNTN